MTVIRIKSTQDVQHGEFNLEVMNKDIQLEEEEMKERDLDKTAKDADNISQTTVSEAPPEYCECCFLAFGRCEPRVRLRGKTVHETCADRLRAA